MNTSYTPSDIMKLVRKGKSKTLWKVIMKYWIESLMELFPSPMKTKNEELFWRETISTKYWSPLLRAVYDQNHSMVKFLIEEYKDNEKLNFTLRDNNVETNIWEDQVFPLAVSISNQNEELLEYFWSKYEYWELNHLILLIEIFFFKT